MNKNKFLTTLLVVAMGLTVTSCSNDYLDVNDNPNAVQAEKITPDLIFPGAVSTAYRTQANTMMQFGNLMMNSWAGNTYSFGGPFAREFNLSTVDNTFYTGIWGLYPRIANFAQIETYPNADHKQDYYVAMAKIMKAYYMQYIVDLYGDAPYSEAFKGQDNMTPKYDDDASIYRALITNINEAITLIQTAQDTNINNINNGLPTVAVVPGGTDIVFEASTDTEMDQWETFARTIKLRMLLRMSKVTGEMATFRDAQLQTLAGATFIEDEVTVNPGYTASNDDQMNPYILTWARTSAGTQVQNYAVVVASEHMANALEGNVILSDSNYSKFTGLKDPRRSRLFTTVVSVDAAGNPFNGLKGVRQGAVPGQPGAPISNTNTSKLGIGNFSGAASVASWLDVIDENNERGGVLMSKAESNLLQAEAALRWPSIFTLITPQAKFNSAILSNGTWLGANASQMNTYITSIASRPGLGWIGTDAQKLEAIMTQKWIALTNVNPTEMFIEYNRTGYPWTPLAVTAQQPNKPLRLVYPFSEYAANAANVPNISSAQVFVKNQYTPFWNQN
ncbi:Starch-binding associating with outer membrane [Chryseobacterium wanjuense]|uniref:Starch-binding associating with outer membrane n=1 Tax=Chryseobacterium wanjuense TaxID=356305 RepID=A0A1I0MLP1_9FLAO|nr:SusD/RagB family nutrient-binding outer membrane lipoprotein [Chryseobacterium wanjuense]SEV89258.1 Starch-binding associating with outer membrane [Chryseobacterium wanjuense]